MVSFGKSHSILLYGFLVTFCISATRRNNTVLDAIRLLRQEVPEEYSRYQGCGQTPRGNTENSNSVYSDPYTSAGSGAIRFRDDLELVKLIGSGDVSYGIEARFMNKTVIAKIATDSDLYYSDLEIDIFRELNRPPTIPNIPELLFSVRSMPNPFASYNRNKNDTVDYLVGGLGLKQNDAEGLVMKRRISVMAMDLLRDKRQPKDLPEVKKLLRSLLETLRFVHSRNVMHCDLHSHNYFWDGETAYIFDWNGGFRYEKDVVQIHYPRAPTHLFPPEAKDNASAVHASVYAFDIYTMGLLAKKLIKQCCGITWKKLRKSALGLEEDRHKAAEGGKNNTKSVNSNEYFDNNMTEEEALGLLDEAMAYELALYMMMPDPHERPDAATALEHPFFTGVNGTNTTAAP